MHLSARIKSEQFNFVTKLGKYWIIIEYYFQILKISYDFSKL